MALERLNNDLVYRWRLAQKAAIADIQAPTVAELNANPSNSPAGLIYDLTCAINTDGSQFDLDDPETDDSTTFCQKAGTTSDMSRSATVVIEYETSSVRWDDASSLLAADGFNTANLAHSLLADPDNEDYVILSIGTDKDADFAADELVSIVEVSTDFAQAQIGTGENIRWTQNFMFKSDIAWNVAVVA